MKFNLTRSHSLHILSIDIYPVMLDDDARYQCQVGPGAQGMDNAISTFLSYSCDIQLKKTHTLKLFYRSTGHSIEIRNNICTRTTRTATYITGRSFGYDRRP